MLTALAASGGAHLLRADEAAEPPRVHVAGTQRTRYESLDPQFRAGFDDADDALTLQTSVTFDVPLDKLQFFGELMDSRALLNDRRSFLSGTVIDAMEPLQAYVAWHAKDLLAPGASSTLRVGRFTLDLGKRRLIGRARFRNTVNNFIGADWLWQSTSGRTLRAFYLQPMRALPDTADGLLANDIELDHPLRGTALVGVYYAPPAPQDAPRLESYLLDYSLEPKPNALATAEDLVTGGVRFYRPAAPHRWSYEVEAVLQTGESGGVVAGVARSDLATRAHFLHAETGYTFAAKASPTLTLQYDVASGDRDPNDARNERFNTLFGARRFEFGPSNIFGPFFRSNLETPGLRLTLKPEPRWQTMFAYRRYALDQPRDAWVGSGFRDPTGAAGTDLGRELEGVFTWDAIPKRVQLEIGVARLWVGRYEEVVEGAALRGDPTFVYTAVTTTF